MWDRYGKAVVEERTKLRKHAELEAYARLEYGEGTGAQAILAEALEEREPKGWLLFRGLEWVLRLLSKVRDLGRSEDARGGDALRAFDEDAGLDALEPVMHSR